MQPKLNPSPRPDAIDAERFREMTRSPLFALFWDRVGAELRRALDACERANDVRELRRAQGAAAALRTIDGLPNKICVELRKKSV
jgi:hypothetical protein